MSERQTPKAENQPKPERSRAGRGEHLPKVEVEAERQKQSRHEQQARKELEAAHESLERRPSVELADSQNETEPAARITPEDKRRAYRHTLRHVQSKLSRPAKRFSRLIHNPAVERTSEVLEKTVARPSAVLGAAVFASLGLAVMSYFARRNGFALSGSELLLFVLIGWLAGLLFELIWRKLIKRT